MMNLLKPPVLLILLAIVARGMTAPLQSSKVKADTTSAQPAPTEQPQTQSADQKQRSLYRGMANLAFEDGVKQAVYARASYLFATAQQQGNAEEWLKAHYRAVSGDVAFLDKSLGSPTGVADQFAQVVNRAAELSATSLAIDWLKSGTFEPGKAAVPLQSILDGYREIQNAEQPAEQPAGQPAQP